MLEKFACTNVIKKQDVIDNLMWHTRNIPTSKHDPIKHIIDHYLGLKNGPLSSNNS